MPAFIHRLRYFFADAWDEFRHSPGVNLLATATLASVLFVAGLILLVLANVEERVAGMRHDIPVEVYLLDSIDDTQLAGLRASLEQHPGIERVAYVDKALALERYSGWAADMAELIGELDSNPLPASLEAYPKRDADARQVAEAIVAGLSGAAGVEEVRFNREWLVRIESLLEVARIGGIVLAVVVFAAVAFVMASVMRLAVYARRDEIEIMTLVGATPAFVRGPFLVAGLGHGLVAAVVAVGAIEGLRRALAAYAGTGPNLMVDLAAASPIPMQYALLLLASGLVVGALGSFFAVRRSIVSV